MADDKDGREDQAQNEERRQRERELATALERGDESEPPLSADATEALDGLSYPVTAAHVVESVGDRTVDAGETTVTVGELLPATEQEVFDSPTPIRTRVRYPGVARAMKRIVEAADPRLAEPLRGAQREAYEKTFRALADVDALDDDAVVDAIEAWVLERVGESGAFPGSRAVRRQAARVCREHGYEISNDDWLGV